MTEEAPDQSFEKYRAAKKAVVAYGLSEEVDDDQQFTTASSNSALRVVDLPGITTTDPHVRAVPTFYVPFGSGKTCVVLSTFTTAAAKFSNSVTIVPAHTTVTSGSPESLLIVAYGASTTASPPALIIEEQSAAEIIGHIRAMLPARYRVELANRLNELEQLVQEEESDDHGIKVGSLLHFVKLLEAHPELRCPAVSISPERNVYASWKSGKDRVFSIHFFPDGRVRFVIFYPNEKHSGNMIRLSGTATVDVVIRIAAPHGILDWMRDEGPSSPRL